LQLKNKDDFLVIDAPVKPEHDRNIVLEHDRNIVLEHDRNIVPEHDREKSRSMTEILCRSMTERKVGACLSEVLSNENLPIRHIPA